MTSYLSKQNLFVLYCLAVGVLFYRVYLPSAELSLRQERTLGQPDQTTAGEELTIIAKMPFLAGNNKNDVAGSVVLDDGVFYRPVDKAVQAEPTVGAGNNTAPSSASEAKELLAELSPVELPIPKADVLTWAYSNLDLQAIALNGAVINGRFIKQGEDLHVRHVFEDGTIFSGTLELIERGYVSIRINSKEVLTVTLKKY